MEDSVTRLAHLNMINPLQAMMAARAGNQNTYGAGVQNTGAIDPQVLLAAQRMNTPTIGTRIDAGNGQMVEVDPYKYANLKQERDYQAAMNARTNNTKMQIANAGAQNSLYLDNLRNDRAMQAANTAYTRGNEQADKRFEREQELLKEGDEKARQRIIDAEAREEKTYQRRIQEQQQAERMKLALTNEQFAELRGPAMEAIQNQTYWNAGGEQETANKYYQAEIASRAIQLGDEAIQNAYINEFKAQNAGKAPAAQLQRMDENGNINAKYQEIANGLLMRDPEFAKIDEDIKRTVAGKVRNTGQVIGQNFRAVSATMTKFGYSPGEIGDYTPSFGPNSLTPPSLSGGLLAPPMSGAGEPIAGDLDVDTSTPQGQEAAAEIDSLKQVYDSLMMQVGGIGAKNEAQIASNLNPLQNFGRNTIGDGFGNASADYIGGEDSNIMDALRYAGVDSDDALMFTNDIDDVSGLDVFNSANEKNAHIKSELERRIAVLQKALVNSQNSQ